MEKINISELLKGCQNGMELDCTEYDGIVKFDGFNKNNPYTIRISVMYNGEITIHSLTKYGQTSVCPYNKCVIFPKGKNTWEGFVPPCKFNDGDIVASLNSSIYIFTNCSSIVGGYFFAPCGLIADHKSENHHFKVGNISISVDNMRLASEKEKQKLFDAIKENGYEWNPESKTLEKLIKPLFKVGYKIKHIKTGHIYEIIKIISNYYIAKYLGSDIMISWNDHDEYVVVSNKFDINNLKPFDKVLVRCSSLEKWRIQFFETYNKSFQHPFICMGYMGYNKYKECIPYEGNEHLLNTNNEPDDFFKTE